MPVALIPACCASAEQSCGRTFLRTGNARSRAMSIGDIAAVIMTVFYLTWFGLWLRSNKW